jgi:hypothetical protein
VIVHVAMALDEQNHFGHGHGHDLRAGLLRPKRPFHHPNPHLVLSPTGVRMSGPRFGTMSNACSDVRTPVRGFGQGPFGHPKGGS